MYFMDVYMHITSSARSVPSLISRCDVFVSEEIYCKQIADGRTFYTQRFVL